MQLSALEHRDPRYRVTGAASPEEGAELLDRQSFDLVLLDYRFPRGGNGLSVFAGMLGATAG